MIKRWFTPERLKWLGLTLVILGLVGNLWLLSGFRTARAADCDDNAVIRCGVVDQAALQQKCDENIDNTQGIYQEFGISNCSSALDGLVVGQVTSDNKVYIRNDDGTFTLVGTDAITAGRQRIADSDTPIAGGSAYERPPSESFRSSPLSALVKMNGNTFAYAVIMSCGNPVKATPTAPPPPPQQSTPPPQQPTPPPSYEITKSDRLDGQSSWGENVVAKPNDQVQFQIVLKNTGQTALDNTTFTDDLPSGLTFVDHSIVADGTPQPNTDPKTGLTLTHFAVGAIVTITFEATTNDVDACNNPLVNSGTMQPPNLPPKSDTATVQVCKPHQHITLIKHVTKVTKVTKVTEKKELINTGPGSMSALFMVSTLTGTALYQLRLRAAKRL